MRNWKVLEWSSHGLNTSLHFPHDTDENLKKHHPHDTDENLKKHPGRTDNIPAETWA